MLTNKPTYNSGLESQLRYIYRLQLIYLRYKYLKFIRHRVKTFIRTFKLFLNTKTKYLINSLYRLKLQLNALIKSNPLTEAKNKISKGLTLLTLESLTPEKTKKLLMSIEYDTMDLIIKTRQLVQTKNSLILRQTKIKNIIKFIQQKQLKFKLKCINYKTISPKITNQQNELRSLYPQIHKHINKVLYERYKSILLKHRVAVVPVYKKIPIGSYILISQRKEDNLFERKHIIRDETSGQILIDYDLADHENKTMKNILFHESLL
ncbi:hypothetical protein [Candidatus Karelsulcia muelleri]